MEAFINHADVWERYITITRYYKHSKIYVDMNKGNGCGMTIVGWCFGCNKHEEEKNNTFPRELVGCAINLIIKRLSIYREAKGKVGKVIQRETKHLE